MIGLCYVIAISCSQPRLDFRPFFHQACMVEYPGFPFERPEQRDSRIADGLAAFADYAERYRDQCTYSVGQKGDKQ